ncbi:MAG: glycosyltransferase [Nitrospira sp.]|nr:glycosyltransferase [Nitrospira sp.]
MEWLDQFYSGPISLSICLGLLLIIALLSNAVRFRRVVLALSVLLYIRYMIWRGVYTLPTETLAMVVIGWTVYLAEIYGLFQYGFFAVQAWSPTNRTAVPLTTYPTVDIFVTVVDEPLDILKRTLIACLHQHYPQDRYSVCVLDDGNRDEIRALAASLGCRYFCRPDRPRHAKAGNLNHALSRTQHEYVAVFDVDHVPVRDFLQETISLFDAPRVAFVQTAHHFYNPDIFQRNLRLQHELQNEQALFFRVLQAGRDAHGSAFFAGSGGMFSRRALEAVGGFQTQTVSEDLHTSLVLHARGYESRYLNKVLSVGLMPDTFEGYLRQRTRWAIGSIQTFLHHNPITIRGLTLRQRIDYVGSIYYFFFGIPRVVCLTAPLSTLLFGIPALHAGVWGLCLNFFSFYLGSAIAMRPVSRGTRNAFWSDVYEIAMCFALSRAVLATLAHPGKERPFEVTPKGQLVAQGPQGELARVYPHLAVFTVLVLGAVAGFYQWGSGGTIPGFGVSLFWACVNIFLLAVAMLVANEQPQVRRLFRLPRAVKAEVRAGRLSLPATTVDICEQGLALTIPHPVFTDPSSVTVRLQDYTGNHVEVAGRMVRQEPTANGNVLAAVHWPELDDKKLHALLTATVGEASEWNRPGLQPASTTARSFRALMEAIFRPWAPLLAKRRQTPRLPVQVPCTADMGGELMQGQTFNLSYNGLAVLFPSHPPVRPTGADLTVEGVTLKVRPIETSSYQKQTLVRFQIEHLEEQNHQWHRVLTSHWFGPHRGQVSQAIG